MGSAIDELSPRSHPNYFYQYQPVEQHYHSHRQLLWDVMRYSGFSASGQWWHFSIGDQMWAWLAINRTQVILL